MDRDANYFYPILDDRNTNADIDTYAFRVSDRQNRTSDFNLPSNLHSGNNASPRGMAMNASFIFVNDSNDKTIYVYDRDSGVVQDARQMDDIFHEQGTSGEVAARELTLDGDYLYVVFNHDAWTYTDSDGNAQSYTMCIRRYYIGTGD